MSSSPRAYHKALVLRLLAVAPVVGALIMAPFVIAEGGVAARSLTELGLRQADSYAFLPTENFLRMIGWYVVGVLMIALLHDPARPRWKSWNRGVAALNTLVYGGTIVGIVLIGTDALFVDTRAARAALPPDSVWRTLADIGGHPVSITGWVMLGVGLFGVQPLVRRLGGGLLLAITFESAMVGLFVAMLALGFAATRWPGFYVFFIKYACFAYGFRAYFRAAMRLEQEPPVRPRRQADGRMSPTE